MAGLLLRGTAAGITLAAEAVAGRMEWLADRADPPPRVPVSRVRMCDLTPREKSEAILADAEGYFAQVNAERAAEWQGWR